MKFDDIEDESQPQTLKFDDLPDEQSASLKKPKEVKQGDFGEQAAAAGIEVLDNLSLAGVPFVLAAQDAYLPGGPSIPEGMSREDFRVRQKKMYEGQQAAFNERNKAGKVVGDIGSLLVGPGVARGAKAVVNGAARAYPLMRSILTAAPMTVGQQAAAGAGTAAATSLLRNVEDLADKPGEVLTNATLSAAVGGAVPYAVRDFGNISSAAANLSRKGAEFLVPAALGVGRSDMGKLKLPAIRRSNKLITEEGLIEGGATPETQARLLGTFKKGEGVKLGKAISARDAAYDVPGNDMAYRVEQNMLDLGKGLDKLNPGFKTPGNMARSFARDMRSRAHIDDITPVTPGSVPGMQVDPSTGQLVPRDRAYDVSMRSTQDWANNLSNRIPSGGLEPGTHADVLNKMRTAALKPFRDEMARNMPQEAAMAAEANRKMEGVNNYLEAVEARAARDAVPTSGLVNFFSPVKQFITQQLVGRGSSALHAGMRNTANTLTSTVQKVQYAMANNPAGLGPLYPILEAAVKRDMEKGNQRNEELKAAIFLNKDKLPSNEKLDQLLDDRSRQ